MVWLYGVRRAGKTFLCQGIDGIEYFDCELPRVRNAIADPEEFLSRMKGKTVALDEIHRLPNPSEILKLAADHFPGIRVLATGSSTLDASARFRDTLTGRKTTLRLLPMVSQDLQDFGNPDLRHRLHRGGLPPFFLNPRFPEAEYTDWIDSYWAKDIQEMFRLERVHAFKKLVELLFLQSGGIFDATRFTGPCEISRQTVTNYLATLEITGVMHVVRPFSKRRSSEIISAPKVYGFDTGFVCAFRGWNRLRQDDLGSLWEHLVLNELLAHVPPGGVRYWRDKRGHEVDFVLERRGRRPLVIECKWREESFDAGGAQCFARRHPVSEVWVVASDVAQPHTRKMGDLKFLWLGIDALGQELLSRRLTG